MRTYIFDGYKNSVFYCSAENMREARQKLKEAVKEPDEWAFEHSERE